jgi:hypothetical protein
MTPIISGVMAFTAAFNFGQQPLLHPATTRRGVIIKKWPSTAP